MNNIKIIQQTSTLDNLTLKQSVNEENLKLLIKSSLLLKTFHNPTSGIFYENEKQQLLALQKTIKNGVSDVIYKRTAGMKIGRVMPQKCLGLVSIRREIRHTIARDHYIDIDVVNCHPVLLYQICKANKIEHSKLEEYINNREFHLNEVMKTYEVSRDQAKTLFITLLYFGSLSKWLNDTNTTNKEPLKYLTELKTELNNIGNIIVASNPVLKKVIQDKKTKGTNKPSEQEIKASLCSTYLQEYENRILETIYEYSINNNYITDNAVLCYDGLMIPKYSYRSEMLKEFEEIVKVKLGFEVTFIKKELDEGYTEQQILDAQIDELTPYELMKQEFEKTHFKIIYPISYAVEDKDGNLKIISKKDFLDTYQNMKVFIKVEDKDGNIKNKLMSFINLWMDDIKIRSFDKIDFLPCQIAPSNIYNTFKGFEAETKTLNDININETYLMKHIKNLCNNNEEVTNYFINCLSNIIQHPYKLTNTSILLKSIQGCGKDAFFDYFGKKILGSKYYSSQDSADLLFGKFNTEIENKLLVILNEASGKDTFTIDNKIKNAITRTINTIEGKGLKPYNNTNNIFYVFLTNSNNAVKIEENDRRFCAIESNDKLANNENYFNNLFNELNSEKIDRAFFEYLNNRDISKVNFTNDRPKTNFYNNLKANNIPIVGRYLCEYVDDLESNKHIYAKHLFENFTNWCASNKMKNEITSTSFGLHLKAYEGIDKKRSETGIKYCIDIPILKAVLIKKNYYEILDVFENENEIKPKLELIVNKCNVISKLDIAILEEDEIEPIKKIVKKQIISKFDVSFNDE